MKKIGFIVFSLFFVAFSIPTAQAFWIWSPKTQEWKNPELSPLATPKLQLQKAKKELGSEDYKSAIKEFRKVLIHYPDAQEAAEAQYYIGRCWEGLDNPYQAFLEYQKVIDTYPNSQRIQEIAERMYHLGEYFFDREPSKWFGLSMYDFIEHPAIEIFKKIIEDAPYSDFAPSAQYKLGIIYAKLERFNEAKDTFQELLDNYPESEWAEAAKYQLALTSAQSSSGVDYDDAARKDALAQFQDFLKTHPETQLAAGAESQFNELRTEEAKKHFSTAQFYEKQKKIESAIIYYEIVANKFADTEYAQRARERLEKIKK
ncbi:MAG: outer membrane protein assembly factor BamD [Candidatus Omnitrophica bacterium]|nr:outer membrane protein assembly factor BamD [Candidatus Omnitrophota bacterium]